MNITVYLGSSLGNSDKYMKAAYELGEWIAGNGCGLIYGGSREGLMGALADGAIDGGGKVTGVEPVFFIEASYQHPGLSELIVVDTMHERKALMMERGDAFIAFPGGTGTLEEIAEIISLVSLGRMSKPYCFYDLDGYYRPFRSMLEHMNCEGFISDRSMSLIRFAKTLDEIGEVFDIAARLNSDAL